MPARSRSVRRERRTVLLAAVGMVLLVLGGIVAGALFAPSGCRELRPRDLGTASTPTPVLASEQEAALDALAGASDIGEPRALARLGVRTGTRLVALDGGVAVVDGPAEGPSTLTVVDDAGTLRSRTGFGRSTTVVGAAPAPYALEVPNRATGQVDALAALAVTVEGVDAGLCVDTAVVGTPLTFLLDAGAGELLLLRMGEDGGDVDLELRDPERGRRWATRLDLPAAPAGLVAARTSAGLGEALVVVGHRSAPLPTGTAVGTTSGAGDSPAVVAVARTDGGERWSVGRDVLQAVGAATGSVDVEVVGVTETRVHVLLVPVEEAAALRGPAHGPLGKAAERAERRGTLVVLAAADGRVLDVVVDAAPAAVRAARDEGSSAAWRAALDGAFGTDLLDVAVTPSRVWALVATPSDAAVPGAVLLGFAP